VGLLLESVYREKRGAKGGRATILSAIIKSQGGKKKKPPLALTLLRGGGKWSVAYREGERGKGSWPAEKVTSSSTLRGF